MIIIVKVFAVADSTYFIWENKVYAVGSNGYGQLGLGTEVNTYNPISIDFLEDKNITNIVGGNGHAFAISEDGDVYAFGYNVYGQLGLGDKEDRYVPVKHPILSSFSSKEIKSGYMHNLLLSDGKLYSWGNNEYGQLGLGDCENRYTPTEIKFFTENDIEIKNFYTGFEYNFVTTTDNEVYAWGYNYYGQLGFIDEEDRESPVELEFFRGVPIRNIQTNDCSTFILTEDGTLYSFGFNAGGELGIGNYLYKSTPQIVNVDNKPVDKIITGRDSTIAITTDGAIYGWGWNDFIHTKKFHDEGISLPTRLSKIEELNPVEIVRGYYHTIIKTQTGELYGLGNNFNGQLTLKNLEAISVPKKIKLNFIK